MLLALALVLLSAQSADEARAAAPPDEILSRASTLGPQDVLKITVYDNPDLGQTVVVDEDGTFDFPLIGRVRAAGQTPQQLERVVAERLAQGYVRNPQVTVVVGSYRSQVVFVAGEVARPGRYPLWQSRTLIEALAQAGPTLPAAGSDVLVVRPRAGSGDRPSLEALASPMAGSAPAEIIRVSLDELQAGAVDKNVRLQANDTVLVPRPRVFVAGDVRRPGAYPLVTGTTVGRAIRLAGGTTGRAAGRVRLVRLRDGRSTELRVGLDEPVLPGDTITVGK